MSTPARSLRTGASISNPNFLSDSEKPGFFDELHSLISNRAYALFEQWGRKDGDHLGHWLQAERELASFPAIQESKDMFTVTVVVGEVPAGQVKVCATDDRVIVSARSHTVTGDSEGIQGSSRETRSLYYMAVWPQRVSDDSYKAEIQNGILTLTVRKAPNSGTETGSHAWAETDSAANTSKHKAT